MGRSVCGSGVFAPAYLLRCSIVISVNAFLATEKRSPRLSMVARIAFRFRLPSALVCFSAAFVKELAPTDSTIATSTSKALAFNGPPLLLKIAT